MNVSSLLIASLTKWWSCDIMLWLGLLCNGVLESVVKDEAAGALVLHAVTVHAFQAQLASKIGSMP